MASFEKIAKSMLNEICESKSAMQAGAVNHFRNQEIVIVQNKNIIKLLECIDQKLDQLICGFQQE